MGEEDPFDRLYLSWAEHALNRRLDPPSRERWDSIVLRLLLSEDPDRVKRYKYIESTMQGGLGDDAYELWRKLPPYTENLTAKARTRAEIRAYAQAHRGTMRELMQSQGLGERYEAILRDYAIYMQERRARARKGQQSVLVIGCVGMGFIVLMALTVLLIVALKLAG
jgi:hypothetical protein